jgi:hypothetical protein
MTWSGKQGFQTPIVDETYHVQDFGVYGNMHQERGLTCASFLSLNTLLSMPRAVFPFILPLLRVLAQPADTRSDRRRVLPERAHDAA